MIQGGFRCQCPLGRWSREIPPKDPPWSISALERTSNLALSAQALMMHRPGGFEHDARHGGSNGCPTWPVAGRHFER